MIDWIIYYDDGSTYTNLDGTPWDAPGRKVVCIAQVNEETGWGARANMDYYVWDTRGNIEEWWGVDINGLWDYLADPGQKKVVFGYMTSKRRYNEILAQMRDDERLPKKAGWYKNEPKER